ncbi:ANK2, partial [Symbiodinium sp. KB8]
MAVGADPACPSTVFFRLDEQDAQLPETRPDGLIINACDSESQVEPDELEVHKAKLEEAKSRQQVTDHSVTELLEKLNQLPGVSSRKHISLQTPSPSGRVEERHSGVSEGTTSALQEAAGQQDAEDAEVPKSKCCEWQLQSGLSGLPRLPGSVQEESIESPSRRFQRAVRQVVRGNRQGTSSLKDGKGQAPCFAAVVAAAVAARNAQQAGAQVFHTPREKTEEAETLKASREDLGSLAGNVTSASLDFHTPRGSLTPVTTPRASGGPQARVSLGGVASPTASASPSVSRAASPEWTQRGLADRSLSPRTPRASSLSGSPANGSLLGESKKRGLPGSAPFAAFGLAMPRDKDSAQAEIEVFSKSLNAWVPGKVWLFASAGKITVTYAVNGHRCRKHLYPWTQQIRSVGEMDPDSAVLDMEDMQQEVEVVGDMLPSWGEEADPEFSFTHLWDALFCEMPMNATLKNAMQAAAQKQEQYCSARTHEASAAYAEAQLAEAEECYAESGELFEDMQDADFQQSIGSFIRLVLHMEAPSLRLWCDRPMALDVVQGRESPNCGLLVAMAAIADHHDGYLVRQLFPQFQDEGHEDPPLNPSGCYVVSLFLHTKNSNLDRFKKHHPSLKSGQDRIILDTTSRSETLTKGSWRSIVVDDRLPIDSMGRLENCQFSKNKVWPCLLEKAFAKVCGSYADTSYVKLADALVMLTGQSTFQIDLTELFPKEKRQLWKDLSEYQRSGILMTAAIYDLSPSFFGDTGSMTKTGLQRNHAYTVLETMSIILDLTGEVLSLVKLRVRGRRQGISEEAPVEEAWHGWTLECTPGGRFFHHHVASGTTQWETPPELIDVLGEWREVGDPGARYWHNAKLETSCWKDPRNCGSIHEAALDGNMAYLLLYATAKGFVDAVNLKGRSALHNAAAAGQDEVIVHLLHQKADVNLPDQGLSTPIHWACRYGHQTAVQLLLQAGANVDGSNMLGDTPLHEAAGLGQVNVLPVLIAAYANPWARNAEKRTAAEVAGVRGWAQARAMLLDYEHMWADREDPDSHQVQAQPLGGGYRPGLARGLVHRHPAMPLVGIRRHELQDDGVRRLLRWRILIISICTGFMAASCFLLGSLFGSLREEHGWAPQVLDFTNFLGILVLFIGMAGAGCVTLRLTSSDEDSALSETQLRVWASMPFCAITMGALPPAFQSYSVHADGHFEWQAPAIIKKEPGQVTRPCQETVHCPCCLAEYDGPDVAPAQHLFWIRG